MPSYLILNFKLELTRDRLCSFVRSFVRSLFRSFVRSFVRFVTFRLVNANLFAR